MKQKPKIRTLSQPNLTKIFKKSQTKSTTIVNKKPKQNIAISKTGMHEKQNKKSKGPGKENVESTNIPSPQNKLKGKNYKPNIKKGAKLELSQNTVSIIISQSNNSSSKKHDLLDSLLYGDIHLTQSCSQLNFKQEENDQLLIETCYQKQSNQPSKNYKNLSPIKSISQYSVTQNQDQIFIVQKIQMKSANVILKIKKKSYDNQSTDAIAHLNKTILLSRILAHFQQKTQGLLNLYLAIHKSITKKQLLLRFRQYLFQNSIIFNKNQLNQFMEVVYNILANTKIDRDFDQLFREKFQILFEQLFLQVNQKNSYLSQNLWLSQDVVQKLFLQKETCSFWSLVQQICSQNNQQIQASFRQSRFCLTMDSSMFIRETDQKRKKEYIQTISKWLHNFMKPSITLVLLQQSKNKMNLEETKINMFSPL